MPGQIVAALSELPIADVVIDVPMCVRESLRRSGKASPGAIRCAALIDSGATHSGVHIEILNRLGIKHSDVANLLTPTSGTTTRVKRYRVKLSVMLSPSPFSIDPLVVTAMAWDDSRFQVIVGIDVLKLGKFSIDGPGQSFSLEF